jgi:hypothetical protein
MFRRLYRVGERERRRQQDHVSTGWLYQLVEHLVNASGVYAGLGDHSDLPNCP